jgi:histidinol phosphatase-like enzyme
MILQAAEKYNIDLAQSVMVGDDLRDLRAGISAGCRAVFLDGGKTIEEPVSEFIQKNNIPVFANLAQFSQSLS